MTNVLLDHAPRGEAPLSLRASRGAKRTLSESGQQLRRVAVRSRTMGSAGDLIAKASAKRGSARCARQLAEGLTQESDRRRLTEYGEALEDEADALERQAAAQPGLSMRVMVESINISSRSSKAWSPAATVDLARL
jgi:hypothetical protein